MIELCVSMTCWFAVRLTYFMFMLYDELWWIDNFGWNVLVILSLSFLYLLSLVSSLSLPTITTTAVATTLISIGDHDFFRPDQATTMSLRSLYHQSLDMFSRSDHSLLSLFFLATRDNTFVIVFDVDHLRWNHHDLLSLYLT